MRLSCIAFSQDTKAQFQDLQEKLQPKKKFGFRGNKKKQTARTEADQPVNPRSAKEAATYQTDGERDSKSGVHFMKQFCPEFTDKT
jgi:hypothetical protein